MAKIIAMLLMLIASAGGGVYYVANQNNPTDVKTSTTSAIVKPSPAQKAIIATDELIDSDLTALDKELSSLQQSDSTLTQDLKGL